MAGEMKFAPSKYDVVKPTKAEVLVQFNGYQMPDAQDLESLSKDDYVKVVFINKEEVVLQIDRTGEEVLQYDRQMTAKEKKVEEEKLYCRVRTNRLLKVNLENNRRVLVFKDEVVGVSEDGHDWY